MVPCIETIHYKFSELRISYSQVLDWAALTLNSHFTKLIFVPEAQTLLVNLHKVIAEQVSKAKVIWATKLQRLATKSDLN